MKDVTIIVPVYKHWKSLKICLLSLKKHLEKNEKVIIINDRAPDYDLIEKKIFDLIRDCDNFHYYLNDKNLGFLKSCNRAVLELDNSDNDILLLNSDTKVTSGFLEEMRNVLYAKNNIAIVCPRTNNAYFLSFPVSRVEKNEIDSKKCFSLYNKYKKYLPIYNIIPTAIGFCMLIKREVINKFGFFDEVYQKGYHEENDYSQRLRKNGYKIAVSNRSFVFHFVGKSFNREEKNSLNERNYKILINRYPNFTVDVENYYNSLNRVDYFSNIIANGGNRVVLCVYKIGIKNIRKVMPIIANFINKYKNIYEIYILIDKKSDDFCLLSKKYENVIFEDFIKPYFFISINFTASFDVNKYYLLNRISIKILNMSMETIKTIGYKNYDKSCDNINDIIK
ncbi:MAG TPA: glycosyltransferase family 2 protein, partial [Spirochaetota bacterium]|nr:glycosyltransferase family 2 protein [Spirochaetota bacterium]